VVEIDASVREVGGAAQSQRVSWRDSNAQVSYLRNDTDSSPRRRRRPGAGVAPAQAGA